MRREGNVGGDVLRPKLRGDVAREDHPVRVGVGIAPEVSAVDVMAAGSSEPGVAGGQPGPRQDQHGNGHRPTNVRCRPPAVFVKRREKEDSPGREGHSGERNILHYILPCKTR